MPTPKGTNSDKPDGLSKASPATTTISTERANEALKQWEKEIGGRDQLADVLILSTLDPRMSQFVRFLTTSRLQEHTLLRLCQDANVSPHEVMELYRKTAFLKGQTIAVTKTAEAMPALVEQLTAAAIDHLAVCFRCKGTGVVYRKAKTDADDISAACKVCEGTGQIFMEADEKAQTKLLNILQLGPKQTTVTAVKIDLPSTQGAGSFSDLIRGSDEAARAIDGLLIEEQPSLTLHDSSTSSTGKEESESPPAAPNLQDGS